MNRNLKFLIAISVGIGLGFFSDNNFGISRANSNEISNISCELNLDKTTSISPLKNNAPKVIELSFIENNLKEFIWDGEKLQKHFEILNFNKSGDISIGSKGYSNINNAVFFKVKDVFGHLNQHNILGVNYNCKSITYS
jgi:hypothetical protein